MCKNRVVHLLVYTMNLVVIFVWVNLLSVYLLERMYVDQKIMSSEKEVTVLLIYC